MQVFENLWGSWKSMKSIQIIANWMTAEVVMEILLRPQMIWESSELLYLEPVRLPSDPLPPSSSQPFSFYSCPASIQASRLSDSGPWTTRALLPKLMFISCPAYIVIVFSYVCGSLVWIHLDLRISGMQVTHTRSGWRNCGQTCPTYDHSEL